MEVFKKSLFKKVIRLSSSKKVVPVISSRKHKSFSQRKKEYEEIKKSKSLSDNNNEKIESSESYSDDNEEIKNGKRRCEDNHEEQPLRKQPKAETTTDAENAEKHILMLKKLQFTMIFMNREQAQAIYTIVAKTGLYEDSGRTFNFDLEQLSPQTILELQMIMKVPLTE